MLILSLIGLIAAAFAIYTFILWFNQYTRHHAQYEFFTKEHSVAMVFSYALMFFGHSWMHTALINHGDSMNGGIIFTAGVLLFAGVIINNFLNAPKLYALIGSIAQIILYIPIAIGAVIIVAVVLAWASGTKPVYVVNN
jgi:FtsH-binding integral membrane protein